MKGAKERRLVNYHTHTWRCLHAQGTEAAYVRRAIDLGFEVLGFADHTPWPYEDDFVSGMRMRLNELQGYLDTVAALRQRYAEKLLIPVGLECEAFPAYMGWLADIKAERLDYLILGNHYDMTDEGDHSAFDDAGGFYFGRCTRPEHVLRYAKRTIAGMETGLFDYVAHPDLFCHTYGVFDAECAAASRDICAAARALDIPLEYNLLGIQYHARGCEAGMLGYPCARFWEIAAEQGCRAIIGFDAHSPEQLDRLDIYDGAVAFLDTLKIERLPHLNRPGCVPRREE
ncbi:MAG: histidinol-phosphatase [Clostridia bacterium]|nr:histidinol-phosphatase [Clostridia bacterium]